MRVIRNQPDQLVLSHAPWGMALILGALGVMLLKSLGKAFMSGEVAWPVILPALALWLLFFQVLVRPVRVVFDRPSQSVEIVTTSLFGRRRVRHGLEEISRAALGRKRTVRGGTQSLVSLEIEQGESAGMHPITEFRSGPRHGEIADVINAWLRAAR